jgi:hypothetical protein
MRTLIQICSLLIGLPLQMMIIAGLLRGAYRRYPVVFAYMVASFLATVMQVPLAVSYVPGMNPGKDPFSSLYWPTEIVMTILEYVVVISLVYLATEMAATRRTLRMMLIAGAVLFASISLVIHYDRSLVMGVWANPWTRDLIFCAAVLDLALWAMLIANPQREHQLLLLSGGLGIQFTGRAIGAAIQHVATQSHWSSLSLFGGMISTTAFLLSLYVWWQAFRTVPSQAKPKVA